MPRPLSVTATKPSAEHLDLDAGGVAGDRLVHRVVDDLGEEVVQRVLVGAADIHARAAAHRLQPLQHLDVRGAIGFAAIADGGGAGARIARGQHRSAGRSRRHGRQTDRQLWPSPRVRDMHRIAFA